MPPSLSGDAVSGDGIPEKGSVERASTTNVAASSANPPPPRAKKLTKYQQEMDDGFKAWISDPANLEGLDVFPQPPPVVKRRKKVRFAGLIPASHRRLIYPGTEATERGRTQKFESVRIYFGSSGYMLTLC